MDSRIEKLLKELTLEEKVEFASCLDDKFGYAKRLGLPGYRTCDNTNVDYAMYDFGKLGEDEKAKLGGWFGTAFPPMSVVANTWDRELAYEVGKAQGKEAKYGGVGMLLRPGVNIKRSPLCGRNFEYCSEDPVLSGEIAGAFIRGVQENKVAACIKHYAGNNQEYERMTTNAHISERALREIYLRSFEIAIRIGNPWTLMTSYNKVNGEYSHANKYMFKVLWEEFGFDGVVMSDCMAVHYDKVKAHKAGLDVELEQSYVHRYQLRDALASGDFSEKELDVIVARVLEVYYRITDNAQIPESIDEAAHHELAVRAAEEGMVLLKNNGILPLDSANTGKIALIGAYAKTPSYYGGGSGHMNGRKVDCAYDTIIEYTGKENLLYADGYEITEGAPPEDVVNEGLIKEAVGAAMEAETIVLLTGTDFGVESEGYDRPGYLLPESHRRLIEAVIEVNQNVILVVNTGSAVQLTEFADRVSAILYAGYAGEGSGSATGGILFGQAEPGGRLSETFPVRIEDTPAYLNFPRFPEIMPDVVYGEDIYVGYRWYEARKIKPLYPFGYGLSYSTFEYKNFKIDKEETDPDSAVKVSVSVRNTGNRVASDVIQLYIANSDDCCLKKYCTELKAFEKVHLNPGEEKTVEMTLGRREFEAFSPFLHKWVVEGGEYRILLGRSAEEILYEGTIRMHSDEKAYGYNPYAASQWITKAPGFYQAVREVMGEQTADFFKNSWLAGMLGSLPFDRFTEVDAGQGKMDKAAVNAIIDRMTEFDRNLEMKEE